MQSAEKWENVYEDSIMDLDFDFEKAIRGFSLQEPNRNVFPGTRSNANTLVATHILLGIFGGVVAGASTKSIDVYLQERPIAGSKRAVIGVRNSQAAEKLQNFDYSKPFSSYEYMKQNGDGAAQNKMDRAVAGLYENVTGKKSNPIKYRYVARSIGYRVRELNEKGYNFFGCNCFVVYNFFDCRIFGTKGILNTIFLHRDIWG